MGSTRTSPAQEETISSAAKGASPIPCPENESACPSALTVIPVLAQVTHININFARCDFRESLSPVARSQAWS